MKNEELAKKVLDAVQISEVISPAGSWMTMKEYASKHTKCSVIDERKEFERWHFGENFPAYANERKGDGYRYPATQKAWETWQARAALSSNVK